MHVQVAVCKKRRQTESEPEGRGKEGRKEARQRGREGKMPPPPRDTKRRRRRRRASSEKCSKMMPHAAKTAFFFCTFLSSRGSS
jgi:hypothetical protein